MGFLLPYSHMPPKEKKTKEAIAKAASQSTKGKAKKKKWNSGKVKEKANNAVYFDEATYEKLLQEIPNSRLITISTVSDKLRVNGSVARIAIRDLEAKGLIKKVDSHQAQLIYTRAVEKAPKEEKQEEKAGAGKKQKGGKKQAK